MNPEQLLLQALACGDLARLFAPRSEGDLPRESLDRLQEVLERMGVAEPVEHLRAFRDHAERDPEGYRSEYVRLFVRGEVPPYEASTDAPSGPFGGPNLHQLADVAGFYRAFGFEARGERPDHLSAELEFLALVCLLEARAHLVGNAEQARVCAEARAAFIRDHLRGWIPVFRERVMQRTSHPALHHLASLVRSVVEASAPTAPPPDALAP